MDIRVLNAFINDEHIGVLTDTNGIWSFEYTSAWINKGYTREEQKANYSINAQCKTWHHGFHNLF